MGRLSTPRASAERLSAPRYSAPRLETPRNSVHLETPRSSYNVETPRESYDSMPRSSVDVERPSYVRPSYVKDDNGHYKRFLLLNQDDEPLPRFYIQIESDPEGDLPGFGTWSLGDHKVEALELNLDGNVCHFALQVFEFNWELRRMDDDNQSFPRVSDVPVFDF